MHEIVRVTLENEMDLILAHKRTMKLAELCGLSLPVQTTFATAVSEIARCAIDEGKEAYLLLAIQFLRGGRKEIQAIITDTSAFCTEHAEHLKYARRLIDDVVLESAPGFTRVVLCYRINFSGTITEARIASFIEYFKTEPPISPYDEIRRKNNQLQSLADKLTESENKFRQLADSLPHMLWTATPDGPVDYFNRRWYEYTGLDGIQNWLPLVHPEDSPKAEQTWSESLRTGAPWLAQNRLRYKRNSAAYRWHEERGVAVRDDKGNIVKWFVSATDIDDQKRLEDKLRESEERARLSVDAAELGMWELDVPTNRLQSSDRFNTIFGYEGSRQLARQEWLDHFHPDDLLMRDEAPRTAMKTGKLSYEARIIRKDGALRWIQVQGKVFYNDKREPMRLVGTLKDVTEHREMIGALSESEQRFRSVADTAPVMIWMSGVDKLCYYFNSAWLTFTGRMFEDEKGNGWADNVHPEDLAMLLNVYNTSFDAHREFYIEYRLRRQDGEYRWISSKGVPRFSNNDVFLGYIGVCIHIHDQRLANEELEKKVAVRTSELKRANQALEDKNRELERSNQELASFSYVASHDLQEPLRKIQAFTQRITEAGEFNETTHDYFNRIRAGARRMQNLIDSLLDFSRVNTSKNIFEAVDLNALVQDVLLHLKDMVEEKAATMMVGVMPQVNVIPVQFHQLLLNLISNALKYSKASVPPVIRVDAERIKGASVMLADIDANKDYWAISVADNGIGFEQQYEYKIFEIFQRLHGRHEYAGTGIGLAICKKIAQNHYGTIVATGVPDEGSVFTVYIPADH